MRVFRSSGQIGTDFGPSVVAIGNFDGVHAGHRLIMRRVVALAREMGYTPAILTFDPHPARVLAADRAPKLLMTIDQRVRAMAAEGIEAVFLLPFSLDFAKLTPEEFADSILAKAMRARVILVGDDFRFGYKQSGNVDTLRTLGQTLGFELEAVTGVARRGKRVSSSGIRNLVTAGAVSRACRMLGGPFTLEGKVVPGQGIGSKQTVPTLNLDPLNEVLPKTGVYVTRTSDLDSSRTWNSITNIGYRPTFNGDSLTVETFLLDPLDAPSPVRIEVAFLKCLREERKFENPTALKSQILKDVNVAVRLHRRLAKSGVGYPFN
jgi:riboflavin kinase / FMN adenylyltransferase